MLKNKSQSIIMSGLFVAIGLILPYFTSHAFGVPGTILLPMHIPVLLCGLLCGPQLGALCGIFTPVLSSVLTGMPPTYPMLPIMVVQLFAMGLVSGLMYRKFKLHLYISLIAAMIAGQAFYGLMFGILLFIGDGTLRALSVPAALIAGFPGLIIQLTLIPATVAVIKKYAGRFYNETYKSVNRKQVIMLDKAMQRIKGGEATCVIIKNNEIVHTEYGRGVAPLLNIFTNEPGKLKGAFVVDKIIGKAAAMILVSGGAEKVHGIVMSASGREYLENHGVAAEYTECVDMIANRDGSDMCPIEKSVIDIDDSLEGLKAIGVTIANLKKAVESV
jgi:hypothetical protein